MYNECIYVCLLTVYREVFLPIVFGNNLLKLSHKYRCCFYDMQCHIFCTTTCS